MSKAIVSEKLVYLVGANFKNGKNYLEFQNPSECIEQTFSLYNNDEKRFEMMINNVEYYYKYLKPDVLVYNSLLKIFSFV